MKAGRHAALFALLAAARLAALVVALLAAPVAGMAAPGRAADARPAALPLVVEAAGPRTFYVVGRPESASADNQGFMSNAGFVVTPDGVVVFDTLGTPALARQLIDRIREKTTAPIRHVVISHYHPDHAYGLEAFKTTGATIWAQRAGAAYLSSPASAERLAERRRTLAPWLDSVTRLAAPDRYVDTEARFNLGGMSFRLIHVGPAHTPEDMVMLVEDEGVLFAGDVIFNGRLPFVGDADSRAWLAAIDRLLQFKPRVIVGGHGRPSASAEHDLRFTRDYLKYLRQTMGDAVDNFVPFDEAYAATDWSAYRQLPVFDESNRINAYNTFLLMERESLKVDR